MASARNLCQHSDIDGIECTSNDYISCPHCQLQLCLKHLNYHQDLLRLDFYTLCDQINRVRWNLDELIFDSVNHRHDLFEKLDHWYKEQIHSINEIYTEKKQQLENVCQQAQTEFQTYKTMKDKQLKDNLLRQLKRVSKQKQIHIDDLNEMKFKLNDIERGLDELKQLLIDVNYDEPKINIQIIKRRYVEAAKTSITEDDDDDDNQWDTDDEENLKDSSVDDPSAPDIMLLSSQSISSCSTTTEKKAPLKFIIKRLKQPNSSTKIKYKFHTITAISSPLLT